MRERCLSFVAFVVFVGFVEVLERLLELVLDLVHALLEALDSLAEATHEFGNLPAAEEQQDDQDDSDDLACPEVHKAQNSVKYHFYSSLIMVNTDANVLLFFQLSDKRINSLKKLCHVANL